MLAQASLSYPPTAQLLDQTSPLYCRIYCRTNLTWTRPILTIDSSNLSCILLDQICPVCCLTTPALTIAVPDLSRLLSDQTYPKYCWTRLALSAAGPDLHCFLYYWTRPPLSTAAGRPDRNNCYIRPVLTIAGPDLS